MRVLVLRPQPGADRTAARIAAVHLDPVVLPLFETLAVAWTPPAQDYDALLVTSAAALRLGGDALDAWRDLPLVAVGGETARTARERGFRTVVNGGGDATRAATTIAAQGFRHVLHLAGADRVEIPSTEGAIIHRVTVYAARSLPSPAGFADALATPALILIHSARAAARLAELVPQGRGRHRLVAISPRAAAAAGTGWHRIGTAPAPTDAAMIEMAAMLVAGR